MFPVDFIIFLQIILFLFIIPGPPRVVIVSHTINYGLKNSVWTAFGDISANICQGILAVFFVGTFLKDNPEIAIELETKIRDIISDDIKDPVADKKAKPKAKSDEQPN